MLASAISQYAVLAFAGVSSVVAAQAPRYSHGQTLARRATAPGLGLLQGVPPACISACTPVGSALTACTNDPAIANATTNPTDCVCTPAVGAGVNACITCAVANNVSAPATGPDSAQGTIDSINQLCANTTSNGTAWAPIVFVSPPVTATASPQSTAAAAPTTSTTKSLANRLTTGSVAGVVILAAGIFAIV